MLYFAYGSNMCAGRLRGRVASAQFSFVAQLPRYILRFHKRHKDGSGKGNAYCTGDTKDSIWGVVFEIRDDERPALDTAEGLGLGYYHATVTVIDPQGKPHEVFAYVAFPDKIDESLRPYGWYKRFVLDGARQYNLPAEYIQTIESTQDMDDPDQEREEQNRRIVC